MNPSHASFNQTHDRRPDDGGHFGPYGGRYVAETLMPAAAWSWRKPSPPLRPDPAIPTELRDLLRDYAGRPTPLFLARAPDRALRRRGDLAQARGPGPHGRPQDQQHPGAGAAGPPDGQAEGHRRDRRRPARRGHGDGRGALRAWSAASSWAWRTWPARRPTSSACGCWAPRSSRSPAARRTLKDAMNEALRDWVACGARHLLRHRLGGRPAPYPLMVRDFQRSSATRPAARCWPPDGRLPDALVACVGGGCNAMGLFYAVPATTRWR